LMNSLNKSEAAIFLMLAVLPAGFPFFKLKHAVIKETNNQSCGAYFIACSRMSGHLIFYHAVMW